MVWAICIVCYLFSYLLMSTEVVSKKLCPSNHYYSKDGCHPCSRCNSFSIVRRKCTRTSDTVCVRCAGVDKALQRPKCRRCPPCGAGQFLTEACTRGSPTQCEWCPPGSYNPKSSYSDICISCRSCYSKGRIQRQPCTSNSDAVCGQCRKGFYSEHGSYKCVPCRECISERQTVVKKCQNDDVGKSCGRHWSFTFQSVNAITDADKNTNSDTIAVEYSDWYRDSYVNGEATTYSATNTPVNGNRDFEDLDNFPIKLVACIVGVTLVVLLFPTVVVCMITIRNRGKLKIPMRRQEQFYVTKQDVCGKNANLM